MCLFVAFILGVSEVLPKFDDWDVGGPVPDGYRHIFDIVRNERRGGALNEKCPTMKATPTRGTLNDEFYKVKTFVLGGVKSGGKRLKSITGSRPISVK